MHIWSQCWNSRWHSSKSHSNCRSYRNCPNLANQPNPNSREPDLSMVLTPEAPHCSSTVQAFNFRDHLDLFEDDKSKVNYVLSYLKGTYFRLFSNPQYWSQQTLLGFRFLIVFRGTHFQLRNLQSSWQSRSQTQDFTCMIAIKLRSI